MSVGQPLLPSLPTASCMDLSSLPKGGWQEVCVGEGGRELPGAEWNSRNCERHLGVMLQEEEGTVPLAEVPDGV